MKVIFLDVDGVLNSAQDGYSYLRCQNNRFQLHIISMKPAQVSLPVLFLCEKYRRVQNETGQNIRRVGDGTSKTA